jgi:hypothetical protein
MMKKRIKIIGPVLDEYLMTRPKDERAIHCFHPSGLHECPRKVYDSYMGVKNTETDDPRFLRVVGNGHAVHSRIQNDLRAAGLLVDDEVPVHDEKYGICGHCDGLLKIGNKSNLGVLEIKSIHERGYRTLYKPHSSHTGQISLYMHILKLDWGVLLYENKNDQRHTEFFVPYDKKNVLPILDKIKYVKRYIDIGQPPPPPPVKDRAHYFCDWCKHLDCR